MTERGEEVAGRRRRPENLPRGGQLGWPTARGGEIWAVRLLGNAFEPFAISFL